MSEISTGRIVVRLAVGFVVVGGILFATAGTLAWPEAWLYLVLHFSVGTFGGLWLKKNDPALLEERMNIRKKPSEGWDRVFVRLATVAVIPYFLLPGLDAVRFQWSQVPWWVQLPAFAVLVAALLVIMWVMKVNSFAVRVVEIQSDRGHQVITTGPYRYVRHPMYAAIIPFFFCLPLFLGSFWTLILSALMSLLFVFRTALEDRTLHDELPGYPDYAARTRYRLVPGVW